LPNADPFRNLSGYNYVVPVVQTQNGNIFHARLDYSINDTNKLYIAYGRQTQITQQPVSLGYVPQYAVEYPGAVTTGDISNIVSVNYTHVFGSTVTNEFNAALSLISDPANMGKPAAVDRFDINNYNCDDPTARAAGPVAAPVTETSTTWRVQERWDYSVPALSDYSLLGYPNVLMPGGFYNNQVHMKKVVPDVQDAVSWVKGPHFFQFGSITKGYPQRHCGYRCISPG